MLLLDQQNVVPFWRKQKNQPRLVFDALNLGLSTNVSLHHTLQPQLPSQLHSWLGVDEPI